MSQMGHQRYRIPGGSAPEGRPGGRPGPGRGTVVLCSAYAAIVAMAWATCRWAPAGAWPVHLLLYGPRWVLGLPILVLLPLAAWRRSWRSVPILGVGLAGSLAVWGFVLPGWGGRVDPPDGSSLRVLTCNVQFGDLDVPALADLVRSERPDLILLQEAGMVDPRAALNLAGWDFRRAGELCLASRFPIVGFSELARPDKPWRVFAIRAEVNWYGRTIPAVSAHLMTPRAGLEAMIRSPIGGLAAFREVARVQRLESGLLRRWVADAPEAILIGGDLNLTAEHPLYRRDWSGLADAFSGSGGGLGETMFTRRIGLRIDHILGGSGWKPGRCRVGPDVGSAHRPVLAEMDWSG